ncbi:hypothetical protein [Nonomuraea cavernae]|uniref:Uncharacterized protein n=1 Tax=Nonomuraea cavernae TaxID=2045107 RepID=A0A917ZEW9_9ACTN|nr:hypothetical protein [Nonomuraea cavernae]MCA2189570.1 hypothetical protein [Nonomuraea cavernae]GGO81578.1 hypothetical protein GCM10012289_70870 [Nonomuraea cavernae]
MHFVYRSWYAGPLSKHARHFPGVTVLDWFRRSWDEAAREDAHEWVRRELGADVYGLYSVFETGEPAPTSMADLRRLMRHHLHYEEDLRVDDHSVRVLTNDDEVKLAYYFVDDALVSAEPDRWSYPVHQGRLLPDAADGPGRPFEPPVSPNTVDLGREGGDGVTYAVVLDFEDGDRSVGGVRSTAFPGVRLPELATALRESDADPERWSGEMLALRALTAPGEDLIGPALERRNRWPTTEDEIIGVHRRRRAALAYPHPRAHARALRLLDGFTPAYGRDPGRSLIHVGDHLAQMCVHTDEPFGHRQWFLFDDIWAAAHPGLAASLIHYAFHWDPRCTRRHPPHAPCADDAYLEIEHNNGHIVRDYEPYDEPEMLSMIAALDAAGEHAERDVLREILTGERAATRVLLVVNRPAHRDRHRRLIGVIAARLHRPEPGTCDVSVFVIRPDRRGEHAAVRTALRLWHELRAAGVDRLAFTMPHSRMGRAMVRRLTGLGGETPPGTRVEVPLEQVRRSSDRWWMTQAAP